MKNKCFLYQFLKFIGKPIFLFIFRPKTKGNVNLPYGEPMILCSNHKSYLDPLLLIISTKDVVHFLAKKELFIGVLKKFFLSVGCIPVNRKEKDKNAVDSAINVLKMKGIIGIFPEGTRNKTKDLLLPFKYGAVSIAKKTNTWIVPVGIKGDYKIFNHKLNIAFGTPYKVMGELEEENKILMNEISKLLKEENES